MTIARSFPEVFTILLCISLLIGCGNDPEGDQTTGELAIAENMVPMPTQDTDTVDASDWCAEHAVPESECTKCHPNLISKFKESGDWCAGHDLPESHCRLCNPGISFPQEDLIRTAVSEISESEIGISLNFRPNSAVCATDGASIQFASASTADRMGLTVQSIQESKRQTVFEGPAEILFDETEVSVITLSVDALVSRWLVSAGDEVRAGDVIAILQSPEIAEIKSAMVSAHAAYKVEENELNRQQQLRDRRLISDLEWERQSARTEQSKAEFLAARSRLFAAGFSAGDIDEILEHGALSNQIPLRASESGVIIERTAQLGELLHAGSTFATVGKPEALWVEARLTEQQMRNVTLGDQLTFSSDGGAVNRVGAEIIWISRFLDPHSRMGTVRARIINPSHKLRAGEFGRVRVVVSDNTDICLVPKDAVQWEGCCNVVFVREGVSLYRPHKVQLIDSDGPFYQVAGGVRPGDEVVIDGAFLMKTELKKSSIGAGCCEVEPVG